MHHAKRWQQATALPPQQAAVLRHIPSVIAQILFNRGVTDPSEVDSFLSEEGDALGDPFLMKGMRAAVHRVRDALHAREQVVVYGDFDADGITSAALLVQALQGFGVSAEPYIPHRVEEGYGLNCEALGRLAEQGAKLVITVDCGISSAGEVAFARTRGLDVIVTDHHHISGEVPDAVAVINPRQADCAYPFKDLAGVGVAFKLVQALITTFGSGATDGGADRFLDLVALGTVADLAPLLGENRALVKRGLKALNPPSRLGLREMALASRLAKIDASTIGYTIGPRLNAAGRLDSAMASYHLLFTTSPEEARDLASVLDDINTDRQQLTADLVQRARQQVLDEAGDVKLLIVAGPDYRAGVVGLVAGRLAEEFYRPAAVVEQGEETSRGSARSIPGFNIVAALDECADLLVRYGGHAQAAGFTVENGNLSALSQRLRCIAEAQLTGSLLEPVLSLDAELPLAGATWEMLSWLERLAPFGYANPAPVLLARRVRVCGAPRVVGKDHLKLKLMDPAGRNVLDAIGFRLGELAGRLSENAFWDVAYRLESNQWGSFPPALQVNIKDMRPWHA
jgi:single-stranded-DNA-specific exonuclease